MNLSLQSGSCNRRLLLLAPSLSRVPGNFRNAKVDRDQYEDLLSEMQRLRGNVYLEDNAVGPEHLTSDGRHDMPVDRESWHVLSIDSDGRVCGCARYLEHQGRTRFSTLQVVKSALAQSDVWGNKLKVAIEADLSAAYRRSIGFVEAGGWALSSELRRTTEALRIALGTFSLASALGGCIGISTATVRNCSSSILKRIGGTPLRFGDIELPPYFDPQYRCTMEVLRFDSDNPNRKYVSWIERMAAEISLLPIVCPRRYAPIFFSPKVEFAAATAGSLAAGVPSVLRGYA